MHSKIQFLTKEFIRYYRRSIKFPFEINFGRCFRFSELMFHILGGELVSVTIMVPDEEYGWPRQHASHAFIKIDGRYYDSESFNGVECWEELNFFIREKAFVGEGYTFEIKNHPSLRSFRRWWKPTKRTLKADRKLLKLIRSKEQK